jgi:proline iminopeptidase
VAHGGPGLWDYVEPLPAELEPYATIHRWDQRGGGRSDLGGPFIVDTFVSDMDAVRAAVGASRWIAGGHSWGAVLALLYALRHADRTLGVLYRRHRPGVVTLAAAPSRRDGAAAGAARWAQLNGTSDEREANRLRWSIDYATEEIGAPHVERMLDQGYSVNRDCNRALNAELDVRAVELFDGIDDLRVPVLIVQSAADPRPLAACDELAERLPTAAQAIIEGAGHFPWVERPHEFSKWSPAGWPNSAERCSDKDPGTGRPFSRLWTRKRARPGPYPMRAVWR